MTKPRTGNQERLFAMEEQGRLSEDALDVLAECVKDPDEEIWARAASLLRNAPPDRAEPLLLQAMEDESILVRTEALRFRRRQFFGGGARTAQSTQPKGSGFGARVRGAFYCPGIPFPGRRSGGIRFLSAGKPLDGTRLLIETFSIWGAVLLKDDLVLIPGWLLGINSKGYHWRCAALHMIDAVMHKQDRGSYGRPDKGAAAGGTRPGGIRRHRRAAVPDGRIDALLRKQKGKPFIKRLL